jgi:glycerol-3-phosphate cytidylyltransferase
MSEREQKYKSQIDAAKDNILEARQRGEQIVYTGGTFDLLHYGHARFLRTCAKIGYTVVSLNTDEFIEEYKGRPPVMAYDERREILLSLTSVMEVVPNVGGADSKPAILAINPDYVVIGDDWAKKDYYAQMQFTQEWLDENDITLLYTPYTKNISSTIIKTRLSNAK